MRRRGARPCAPTNFMFKKILIINTFGIGDVLFTTPLISNVKRAYPSTIIHYLTNPRSSDVLKHNPKIEKIFIMNAMRSMPHTSVRSLNSLIKAGSSSVSSRPKNMTLSSTFRSTAA